MKLPTQRKEIEKDISRYSVLVYGQPKVGKTTLLSSWPDVIFLTTEPGTRGISIFEIECPTWKRMLHAVDALEAETGRFKTVVIDTVDEAYNSCLDYTCKRLGIDHPGEDAQGREDWGKSWREVRNEFTNVIQRILRTGRGLAFTSHAREAEIRVRFTGDKYTRIVPSMSGQARGVIEALVDIILYAEHVKDADGKPQRVLICVGDETVWAGARPPAQFPSVLPLERTNGYKIVEAGFLGKHPGVNLLQVSPARETSETAGRLIGKLRSRQKAGKKGS